MAKKTPKPAQPNGEPPADIAAQIREQFPAVDFTGKDGRRQMLYLYTLQQTGTCVAAAKAAQVGRTHAWLWGKRDPAFATAVEACRSIAMQQVEDGLFVRATVGRPKAIYYEGKQVGIEMEQSDTAAIFLLKGWRRDRYMDRSSMEHSLSPAFLALHTQWQQAREQVNQTRQAPSLPAYEDEDEVDVPEGELETPPSPAWRIRPPGAASRREFYDQMDGINGPWRHDRHGREE